MKTPIHYSVRKTDVVTYPYTVFGYLGTYLQLPKPDGYFFL